jgi:hypothetical protein
MISGFVLAVHPGLGNKWRAATSINNLSFGGTGAAVNTVTTPSGILDLGLGAESASEAAVSFTGEALGGIVTGIKFGYDLASFTAAYFLGCK